LKFLSNEVSFHAKPLRLKDFSLMMSQYVRAGLSLSLVVTRKELSRVVKEAFDKMYVALPAFWNESILQPRGDWLQSCALYNMALTEFGTFLRKKVYQQLDGGQAHGDALSQLLDDAQLQTKLFQLKADICLAAQGIGEGIHVVSKSHCWE
jgi:hypothetical protein